MVTNLLKEREKNVGKEWQCDGKQYTNNMRRAYTQIHAAKLKMEECD